MLLYGFAFTMSYVMKHKNALIYPVEVVFHMSVLFTMMVVITVLGMTSLLGSYQSGWSNPWHSCL